MKSVLFTPGNRADRVAKAWASGAADVVVADLEDAVPPEEKAAARDHVVGILGTEAACIRAVRINAWPSALGDADLAAVITADAPDWIVVPKAEDVDAIRALDQRIEDLEAEAGVEPGSVQLMLILETAAGVLSARELAAASGRVAALAFGAEDLAADAGMRRTPENVEVAVPRSLVALAAAASGVAAIDMITADFRDDVRTRREALEARGLGYAGKMCLHPAQVAVVHDAFAPTEQEVAWAKKVVAAADEAGAGAGGVVVVDGRMVDVPLIRQARRIVDDAER